MSTHAARVSHKSGVAIQRNACCARAPRARIGGVLFLLMNAAGARADTAQGLVLGPEGKPAANARIFVRVFLFGREKDLNREIKSDAAGRFSVEYKASGGSEDIIGKAAVYAPGLALSGGALKKTGNTFQLERGGAAAGFVKDAKGQAVAGARVKVLYVKAENDPDYARSFSVENPVLNDIFSARTGADGRWTIADLPTTGAVVVLLDDAAWAKNSATVEAGTQAPALVARPGAMLRGRAIYEDGKPAAGVEVTAFSQQGGKAKSGEDGSYEIKSLSPGSYGVSGKLEGGQWVAIGLNAVVVQEGAGNKAPDLVLTRGALVSGTVVDDETGAPLADVYVEGAVTEKNGRYQVRLAPGEASLGIGVPKEYLQPQQMPTIALEKGDKKDVPIRLKKGLALSGTAVDSDGKPAVGARIRIGQNHSYEPSIAVVDARGAWNVVGLKPGEVEFFPEGEWQLVEPKSVSLPLQRPRSVQVTLKKLALQDVSGRVLDSKGAPVAGARVVFTTEVPLSGGVWTGRVQKLKSDEEGRFTLHNARPDDKMTIEVEKSGFRLASGGAITRANDAWQVSDVVLKSLGGRVAGQVLMRGAPIANARVLSPDGGPQAQAATDEKGRFVLELLPEGEVTLMAARNNDWAQMSAQSNAGGAPSDVRLELKPLVLATAKPSDLACGYAILEDVLKQSKGTKYYARRSLPFTLAPYDPDLAMKLAAQTEDGDKDWMLGAMIEQLAETDPARAVAWAPAQLEKVGNLRQRASAAATLGLAVAENNPGLAADLLRQSREWQAGAPKIQDSWGVYTLFNIAALAARIKSPDTNKIFGDALVTTLNALETGPQSANDILVAAAESVARGSLELVEKIAEQLPPGARVHALSRAAAPLAKYDLAGARKLLDKIENTRNVEKSNRGNEDPHWAFGLAAKPVITALGKTDPAAALALARRVAHPDHEALSLALAAQFQPAAERETLFREAMNLASERGWESKSQIAAMAFEVDAVLGAVLFRELRASLAKSPASPDSSEGVAALAFYSARVTPAQSRLLLESEYARLRQSATASGWSFGDVVLAMSAVDTNRALEMARQVPDDEGGARFDLQRKIAQYVVAPEPVRRTLPFARWNASDSWTPGTDTGW